MSSDHELPPDVEAGFARLDEIATDPAKLAAWKAEIMAKGKAENPHLSDEALEAQWRYVESLFFT